MSIKRTATVLVLGLCLTTATVACSDSKKDDAAATREEFIVQIRKSQSDAFTSQVKESGVDGKQAAAAYDAFIGCTYDAIKDDPGLVKRALATDAAQDKELNTTLASKAEDCQNTFNTDMSALLAAVPTTTVAP